MVFYPAVAPTALPSHASWPRVRSKRHKRAYLSDTDARLHSGGARGRFYSAPSSRTRTTRGREACGRPEYFKHRHSFPPHVLVLSLSSLSCEYHSLSAVISYQHLKLRNYQAVCYYCCCCWTSTLLMPTLQQYHIADSSIICMIPGAVCTYTYS